MDAIRVDIFWTTAIAAKSARREFTVTGVVTLADGDLPAGSSLALFTTPTARELFESGQDDNAIAIKLEPGADRDKVIEQLRAIIFSGAEVSTGAEYAEHRQASFEKSFTLIRALLVGFAALALVVGAFTAWRGARATAPAEATLGELMVVSPSVPLKTLPSPDTATAQARPRATPPMTLAPPEP